MEWIFLKNLKMISWSEKFIKKVSILIFTGLLIFDNCDSLGPQTFDYLHQNNITLDNLTLHATSINTAKSICSKRLPDGSEVRIDCPTTESPNKEDNLLKNDSSIIIPLNSSKDHIDLTNISSTTENSELASMTDKSHLYTGGLDVDEIKTKNQSNVNKNISTEPSIQPSNSSVDNSKIHKNVVDQRGVKSKNTTATTGASIMKKNDSHSRKLRSTTAAGIAAGICVTLGAVAYVSLILWKKISYNRYGNREMLLNEDDLGDIHDEDMRHFEAACIQIEN